MQLYGAPIGVPSVWRNRPSSHSKQGSLQHSLISVINSFEVKLVLWLSVGCCQVRCSSRSRASAITMLGKRATVSKLTWNPRLDLTELEFNNSTKWYPSLINVCFLPTSGCKTSDIFCIKLWPGESTELEISQKSSPSLWILMFPWR